MSKGNENNYLFGEKDDPFTPNSMFGKNYESAIKDPQNLQQHQTAVGAENPATKIDFEDFDLGKQPAFAQAPPPFPGASNSTTTSSVTPSVALQDDLGFDQPLPTTNTASSSQPETPKNYRIWNIEYYQFLFNVDTTQVLHRLFKSVIPFPPRFFEIARANPDLYGPFWIATTLVFIMAATGNVATYFNAIKHGQPEVWFFDADKLSIAAGTIYGYLTLIPLALWGINRYFKIGLTLMEILCIYGYSFFIFLPVSFLSIVPFDWVRWLLIGIAAAISTTFIVANFFKAFHGNMAKGFIILIVQAVLQVGFALTAKFVFFN